MQAVFQKPHKMIWLVVVGNFLQNAFQAAPVAIFNVLKM